MSEVQDKGLHELQEDGDDAGNFYPTHHVVLAFDDRAQASAAAKALAEAGFDTIREIDDQHMISASQRGLDSAGFIAALGSSLKMVELHNQLAKQGCHFLMVKAASDDQTEKLMSIIRRKPYRLAQKYHRLVIETLS